MRWLSLQGDLNIIASFDRRGKYIYTGNAKGRILVLNSHTLKVEASFKITVGTSSATAVKSIEFARRSDSFLINTSDRIIRVYDAKEVIACGKDGEPEPIQKLQDLVNKYASCDFSAPPKIGRAPNHTQIIQLSRAPNSVFQNDVEKVLLLRRR